MHGHIIMHRGYIGVTYIGWYPRGRGIIGRTTTAPILQGDTRYILKSTICTSTGVIFWITITLSANEYVTVEKISAATTNAIAISFSCRTVFIAIVTESTACSTQFRLFSAPYSKPNEILTPFDVIFFLPRRCVIGFSNF